MCPRREKGRGVWRKEPTARKARDVAREVGAVLIQVFPCSDPFFCLLRLLLVIISVTIGIVMGDVDKSFLQ
jgi:hypothetical protein